MLCRPPPPRQAHKSFYDNKEDLLQLWVHETFRAVGDRMWDPADVSWLRKQIDERLSSAFGTNFATLFEDFKEEVRGPCTCTCACRPVTAAQIRWQTVCRETR